MMSKASGGEYSGISTQHSQEARVIINGPNFSLGTHSLEDNTGHCSAYMRIKVSTIAIMSE